jgi:hypothetical protein
VFVLFTLMVRLGESYIPMLTNVSLWVIWLLRRGINVIILLCGSVLSQWMLPYLSCTHIFHPPTLLFKSRVQLKRSLLWVILCLSLLMCLSMRNNNCLLMSFPTNNSYVLISSMRHCHWRSRECDDLTTAPK